MTKEVNRKEMQILIEAIESVLNDIEFDFMEVQLRSPVYNEEDGRANLSLLCIAGEPVDAIEIPDEFSKQAKKFGFNDTHYKAQFIFKGNQYKLVGFKNGKCLVENSANKRFKLGVPAVQKGIATTEENEQNVAPAKKKTTKAKKESKTSTAPNLNQRLKEAELWQKGMQFLSAVEKTTILTTKGKGVEAKMVYVSLKKKLAKVYGD